MAKLGKVINAAKKTAKRANDKTVAAKLAAKTSPGTITDADAKMMKNMPKYPSKGRKAMTDLAKKTSLGVVSDKDAKIMKAAAAKKKARTTAKKK